MPSFRVMYVVGLMAAASALPGRLHQPMLCLGDSEAAAARELAASRRQRLIIVTLLRCYWRRALLRYQCRPPSSLPDRPGRKIEMRFPRFRRRVAGGAAFAITRRRSIRGIIIASIMCWRTVYDSGFAMRRADEWL